jgi:hypothetical protein
VVEFLRRRTPRQAPRLLGVTGASAGSINALLTAIRWCEASPSSTAEDNLFAQAWRPIGFDKLLPGRDVDYFAGGERWPEDLLLSRKAAFAAILDRVEESLQAPRYRDCELKLGFTVTSMAPRVLALRGLRVRNQRFVIPMMVRATGGRIHFSVDTGIQDNQRQDLLGNLLFLAPSGPNRASYEIEYRDVIRAALASSAYPFAFGPVDLAYCAPREECGAADSTENEACERLVRETGLGAGGVACRKKFIDGGVFDNVPLGVAMAQIESSMQPQAAAADAATPVAPAHRPLRYIYMYPGNRRSPDPETGGPPAAQMASTRRRGPLLGTFEFLSGAVDTASDYELHNVLRYNLWNAGTPQLGEALAELVAREQGGKAPPLDVARARAGAARLREMARRRPGRAELASALRDASRALEQLSSQPTAATAEARERDRDAYLAIRADILDSVVAVCGGAGPAAELCGGKRRELLLQARELQNDIRNERRLVLSRRFSPLAGTHIAHFGGFLDRPLRDYDYYAGIYDALWSVAELACDISAAQETGVHTDEMQQQAGPAAREIAPVEREARASCRRREFEAARRALAIEPGSAAHDITEALWLAEHEGERPAPDERPIGRAMAALFDPLRCADDPVGPVVIQPAADPARSRAPDAASQASPAAGPAPARPHRRGPMCLRDLDLAAFAAALRRADYRPSGDSPFMQWVLDHPQGGWWALPGVFAAGRLVALARAENMGKTLTGAALSETYLESYVDQHTRTFLVAPSSLPDRGMSRWAGLLFPFAALSLDRTRRFELGLLRGGVRLGPTGDVSGPAMLLPWDLLAELSGRVGVQPPGPEADDHGYGLFTRGSTTLHASLAPTLRVGGILWSIGFRAGVPVPVGPLHSTFSFEEEMNTEVVTTFLGDKLRFAFGCNPLQPAPSDGCWRDLYYSFGVNDLAGLAYWTGWNPYKLERLFIPFAAARASAEEPSGEIGIVRGGWQPWRFLGLWADASVVLGSDTTANASIAYEAELGAWVRRVGLRGGIPLSIREDARIRDSNLELVLTFPHGVRVAAGTFAFHVFDDEVPWSEGSYVSLGWDPGSILLRAVRAVRGEPP